MGVFFCCLTISIVTKLKKKFVQATSSSADMEFSFFILVLKNLEEHLKRTSSTKKFSFLDIFKNCLTWSTLVEEATKETLLAPRRAGFGTGTSDER